MKYVSIWIIGCLFIGWRKGTADGEIDLQHTIEIANDSSLSAFRYQKYVFIGLLGIQNL